MIGELIAITIGTVVIGVGIDFHIRSKISTMSEYRVRRYEELFEKYREDWRYCYNPDAEPWQHDRYILNIMSTINAKVYK
jgi:hypothetical protein